MRPTDFGTLQYGSHLMNIVFDPSRFGELGSYGFDESGLAATREYLIQGGVLLRGLGGLSHRVGLESLGLQILDLHPGIDLPLIGWPMSILREALIR